MDEYLKSMKDYNPEGINKTGAMMQIKPITIIDSLPQKTAVSDDKTIEQEVSLPKYLAPRKIEVKRYILKK